MSPHEAHLSGNWNHETLNSQCQGIADAYGSYILWYIQIVAIPPDFFLPNNKPALLAARIPFPMQLHQ